MRIAIDALSCLPGRTGGIETYVRELLRQLFALDHGHHLSVFAQPDARTRWGLPDGGARWITPARESRSLGEAFALGQSWLPAQAEQHRIELVHHVKNYACFSGRFRRVLTLHDLFPDFLLRHDWPRQALNNAARLLGMMASARAADHVIAVSEATGGEIRRVVGLGAERVSVVPNAVRLPSPTRLSLGERGYFVTIGKSARYKNLPRLLRAYLRAGVQRPLWVAGVSGWQGGAVERELAGLAARSSGTIRLLGYVPDGELVALYRGARAIFCPSLVEGFGLTPLEAASLGVPAAVSDIAAHREVMADAALRFDPLDEPAIASALRRLDGDDLLCKQLGDAGRARAALYSWRRTAELTLAVYQRAGHEPGSRVADGGAHAVRARGSVRTV